MENWCQIQGRTWVLILLGHAVLELSFSLTDWHIVEVDVYGPTNVLGNQFSVKTVRSNPADPGAVTGSATYNSFLSSILRAMNKGPGIHLC